MSYRTVHLCASEFRACALNGRKSWRRCGIVCLGGMGMVWYGVSDYIEEVVGAGNAGDVTYCTLEEELLLGHLVTVQ